MFYYVGRKAHIAQTYPPPAYPLVIEPFAGSMAYTLHHRPPFAIGIDSSRPVVDLWHRLTAMSIDEIESAPAPVVGERTDDLWHILTAGGSQITSRTARTANTFMVERFERQRRLAIRHHAFARERVLYAHGDYTDAPDVEATWFVDPPYQLFDRYTDRPDFGSLARWMMTRRGQMIVCEGSGAEWLDFREHVDTQQRTRRLTGSSEPIRELIWIANTSRPCEQCSRRFDGRSDARFCSTRCRVAAHRSRADLT